MIAVGPPEDEVEVPLAMMHFGEVNAPPVRQGTVVIVPALVVGSSVRNGATELSGLRVVLVLLMNSVELRTWVFEAVCELFQ